MNGVDSAWKRGRRRLLRGWRRRRAMRTLAAFHRDAPSVERAVRGALDLGTRGEYCVKSVQIESEITALAKAVATIEPRTILEIGTHRAGDCRCANYVR